MTDTKHSRLDELKIDRDDAPRRGGGLGLALLAILLLAAVLGGGWFYLRGGAAPTVRVATVDALTAAQTAAAASVLDASGYVTARRQATVSSKITGKITEVLIEEGMEVEEGQILARLDASSQDRQLALAQAQLAAARSGLAENEVLLTDARRDVERARHLVEANVQSASQLEDLVAQVDTLEARLAVGRGQISVAERQVEVIRQNIADHIVRAPFDGVVVTKNAQPGEMISPVSAGGGFTRTGIGTVVDMASLEIEVDVNESYINRVRTGQEVVATLDAYPDWKIPARVITTVPTADRQKATVRVRIGFEQLDPRILPEMGVRVAFLDESEPSLPTAAADEGPRWRIPEAALRASAENPDTGIVFVVKEGLVERRAVRIGSRQNGRVILLAGVASGENVVVEAPEGLQDGDAVRVE